MVKKNGKKTKNLVYLIITLFILSSVASVFVVKVKASNYEWILNGGFEDSTGTTLITNGNFESGALDGSFSDITGATVETVRYYSATHSMLLSDGDEAWMNFTDTPISNLNEMGAWVRSGSDSNPSSFTLKAYYSDATFDAEITPETVTPTYAYFDWLDLLGTLQEGKELCAIKIGGDASYGAYFDDVIATTVELGQTEITTSTTPWSSREGDSDNTIIHTVSHSGNSSLSSTTGTLINSAIYQTLDYLDSNHAVSLSCWVSTQSSGTHRVSMKVYYSDGTYQFEEKAFNSPSVWSRLDFSDLIVPNKIMIQLEVATREVLGDSTIYIDDISLLADIPLTTNAFSFVVFPAPIIYYLATENKGWGQLIGTASVVQCTLYDDDGLTTENGTVTVSSPYMLSTISTMSNGTFTFNVVTANRNFATNTQELIVMQVSVTGGRSLILTLTIYWTPAAATPTPTPTEGTDTEISNITDALVGFSVSGAFLLIPVWLLGFKLKGGKWGVIIGLVIGCGLGYTLAPAYVPVWLVFLVGCGLVGMLYSIKDSD